MRKSLLGILLAATLLPTSVAFAQSVVGASPPGGFVQGGLGDRQITAGPTRNQAAILRRLRALIQSNKTLKEAMQTELNRPRANDSDVVNAAILAFPSQAGEVVKFAISLGVNAVVATNAAIAMAPNQITDITSAAVEAAPNEAKAILAAALAVAPTGSVNAITAAAINAAPDQAQVLTNTANASQTASTFSFATTSGTGFVVSATPSSSTGGGGGSSTVVASRS